MRIKPLFKYSLLFLILATCLFTYLANRDLIKMYGGLTPIVDAANTDASNTSLIIRNVNILAPDASRFIPSRDVLIENGMITAIGEHIGELPHTSSIDGNGKYLIPGLVDAHVHLFKSRNDLILYLANGVTHIRELIGEQDHLIWRKETATKSLGPDMFIASPRIGTFGTVEGWFMSWSQGYINLQSPEQARSEVLAMHKQGYDAVKIYSQISAEVYQAVAKAARSLGMKVVGHVPWGLELDDIYASQDGIGHLEEVMNALNREFGNFKNHQKKNWDGSGFDSTTTQEFLTFIETRMIDVADQFVKHDIAITSTLWLVESFIRQKMELSSVLTEVELAYENPGISEWSATAPRGIGWLPTVNRYKWPDEWSQERREKSEKYWRTYAKACQLILKHLVNNGVKILAGTDANLPPAVPGFSLHDELISMHRSGMSAQQVLRSATSEPAVWLDNNAGEITQGRVANLVLLDKNPLANIANTKSINSVVIKGQLLDRSRLNQLLEQVRAANNSARGVDISQYLH